MTRAPDPTSKVEVGKRLALTRKALGHTTTKMCKLMGSKSGGSAWSNYEGGGGASLASRRSSCARPVASHSRGFIRGTLKPCQKNCRKKSRR
jgi:hypothetical protein